MIYRLQIIIKNEQAEQYLSLVKKTDDAFKQLVEYFSKVKEPTIIVMYGDHQPAVQSSSMTAFLERVQAVLQMKN